MTGDAEDIRQRLRLTLPVRWFADVAPVLDGILAGVSVAWSGLYGLLGIVRLQSRVSTATDEFLDLAAADFFGTDFGRRQAETDAPFRVRLLWAMGRERATRAALVNVARQAGFAVTIFEPAQPSDTGAYNVSNGLAWGMVGGWGSLQMPLECLITATPGQAAFNAELWQGIAESVPAGGVGWLRLTN